MINQHPPTLIYDEDKAAYYAALESYDKDEALEPMHGFLRFQVCKTWEKALEREAHRRQSHT